MLYCLEGIDHMLNVSVNSKPDHPWEKNWRTFVNGRILHPPDTKKVPNPDHRGQKNHAKAPLPGQLFSAALKCLYV